MSILLSPQTHELGALTVKRLLPNAKQRMVGPFIFFDQFGPVTFAPGEGVDVRPHPHIGLSTLSYLFEGTLLHRDSLNHCVEIHPGDVNWMTAGSGIVHSERETIEVRTRPHNLNGVQCWVALPPSAAETKPTFEHVQKARLPHRHCDGLIIRVIVGEAYQLTSPVITYTPMFFVDVVGQQDAQLSHPNTHQEAAIFVVSGRIEVHGKTFSAGDFVVLSEHDTPINFLGYSRLLLLGGDKYEQQPYIYWNFVAYDKERIEQAKLDWQQQRFAKVIDDNDEYIAL